MTGYADLLLLALIALDLMIVSSSRIPACVRATALQGVVLALLPGALWAGESSAPLVHLVGMSVVAFLVKVVIIPALLFRAIRAAEVRREVEPFVSLHLSLLVAAVLVGVAFWLASALELPRAAPSALLVPSAFATVFLGFVILVGRRKAVTQVVGYLMLENGAFVFGQLLVTETPFVVELGILLDLLVAVFVMGIAIHHISEEFDHIDTERLSALRD